jgi:hypothetical protein
MATPRSKAEDMSTLYLRSGFELLQNEGRNGGATTNIGGFNLVYFYPLLSKLFIGLGYASSFDLIAGSVPIDGYSFHGKLYFRGQGTVIETQAKWGTSSYRELQAYYFGASYNYNSYYLGTDPDGLSDREQMTGKYSAVNLYVGADYAINRKFGLNTEFGATLLPLTGSDDRVKIRHLSIMAGLSFYF